MFVSVGYTLLTASYTMFVTKLVEPFTLHIDIHQQKNLFNRAHLLLQACVTDILHALQTCAIAQCSKLHVIVHYSAIICLKVMMAQRNNKV